MPCALKVVMLSLLYCYWELFKISHRVISIYPGSNKMQFSSTRALLHGQCKAIKARIQQTRQKISFFTKHGGVVFCNRAVQCSSLSCKVLTTCINVNFDGAENKHAPNLNFVPVHKTARTKERSRTFVFSHVHELFKIYSSASQIMAKARLLVHFIALVLTKSWGNQFPRLHRMSSEKLHRYLSAKPNSWARAYELHGHEPIINVEDRNASHSFPL